MLKGSTPIYHVYLEAVLFPVTVGFILRVCVTLQSLFFIVCFRQYAVLLYFFISNTVTHIETYFYSCRN